MKRTEMEIQILTILSNIWLAINGFLSTCWGKIVFVALFIGSTFAPISGLIHLTLILVFIDMFFGIAVTVKTKGWKHLLSSRLRDSLIKLFFYLLFIMLFFLIEKELFDQWYIGAKAVLNGFTSLMAGAVLMWASVPTLAVIGLASLFGTLGTEAVCKYFKKQINKNIKTIKSDMEEK